MIGIIDYKINNIASVVNAIKFLNIDYEVVTDPKILSDFNMLILPGVGAFDSGVKALQSSGMFDGLQKLDLKFTKLFGICLGMQLLCESSEEGNLKGLGLVNGKVVHLKNKGCVGKIPHVGFNTIKSSSKHIFLESMLGSDFYFVHSYGLNTDCKNIKTASCNYGGAKIIAALQSGNIYGSQFHPEKSGHRGLELIRRVYKC